MNQLFECQTKTTPGHGPKIFWRKSQILELDSNDTWPGCLPSDLIRELNAFSMDRGWRSNNPAEYLYWEFPSNGVAFAKAVVCLLTSGWQCRKE